MDNQHQQITGYRELSQAEIDLMNEIKAMAEKCGALVGKVSRYVGTTDSSGIEVDGRWAAIAKTDLQTGFMALIRSVARPTTF